MKSILLSTTLLLCLLPPRSPAQSAGDFDTGGRLTHHKLDDVDVYTFKWWGKSGRTFFIQQSDDLVKWNYSPIIEKGNGELLEYGIHSSADSLFVRLQYTDQFTYYPEDGDFDGDGISNLDEIMMLPIQGNPFDASSKDGDEMPDDWERFYGLNPLIDDSMEDPDGDGLTNYEEFLFGTNPRDYYNGETPEIAVLVGPQTVDVGGYTARPFKFLVTSQIGVPLPNAPVDISVLGGHQGLAMGAGPEVETSSSITARTGSTGEVDSTSTPIYFSAGAIPNTQYLVQISAGEAYSSFWISVTENSTFGLSSPRHLERKENANGSVSYSWIARPMDAEFFFIEEQNSNGEWIKVYEVPVSSLPPPDPQSGVIEITFNP